MTFSPPPFFHELVYRVCLWRPGVDPSVSKFGSGGHQSLLSEAGITNELPRSCGIYVGPADWNSDLHDCPASALRAEPSPQLI